MTSDNPTYANGAEVERGATLYLPATMGKARWVLRDGRVIWQYRCPQHSPGWGDVDADQFYGRVSIQCYQEGCSTHFTAHLADELNLSPSYRYEESLQS